MPLSGATRLLAERLSPSVEGAKLASRLWPVLLKEKPFDVDGWTLFSEALRLLGRSEAAERVDGIAAVLSDSELAAPSAQIIPRAPPSGFQHPTPPGAVAPVTDQSLPRVHAVLRPLLKKLGAGGMRCCWIRWVAWRPGWPARTSWCSARARSRASARWSWATSAPWR